MQFPIYSTENSYRTNEYRIEPLSEKHRGWLKSVQPYLGDFGPKGTLLYWLNELARRDRHRQLTVVGAYVADSSPMIRLDREGAVLFEDMDPYVFVQGEAEIARFEITPFTKGDNVEANPNTALDIEIMEIAQQRPAEAKWLFTPLNERLFIIEAFVDAIVGRFERSCTGYTRSKAVAKEPEINGPSE